MNKVYQMVSDVSTTTAGFRQGFLDDLFGRIAPRYDLVNAVQSFGIDAALRRAAGRLARHGVVLDAGAGSGDMARACLRAGATAAVCLDRSPEMLALARAKLAPFRGRSHFVVGDLRRLPFRESVFDGAASGFVFRNLPLAPAMFSELKRVLKAGAPFATLDLFAPPRGAWGALYRLYLKWALPVWGTLLTGDVPAYRYLAASVDRCFTPAAFAAALAAAGFGPADLYPRLGGIAYIVAARAK